MQLVITSDIPINYESRYFVTKQFIRLGIKLQGLLIVRPRWYALHPSNQSRYIVILRGVRNNIVSFSFFL